MYSSCLDYYLISFVFVCIMYVVVTVDFSRWRSYGKSHCHQHCQQWAVSHDDEHIRSGMYVIVSFLPCILAWTLSPSMRVVAITTVMYWLCHTDCVVVALTVVCWLVWCDGMCRRTVPRLEWLLWSGCPKEVCMYQYKQNYITCRASGLYVITMKRAIVQ